MPELIFMDFIVWLKIVSEGKAEACRVVENFQPRGGKRKVSAVLSLGLLKRLASIEGLVSLQTGSKKGEYF